MKFTDGYWLLREGVTAAYPAEVLDVTESDGALEIHAPTRPVRSRGDLLKGPVLTLRAHTPMPDVIGLTLTHFTGGEPRGPEFELTGSGAAPQVSYDDEHATSNAGYTRCMSCRKPSSWTRPSSPAACTCATSSWLRASTSSPHRTPTTRSSDRATRPSASRNVG
jgi:hypothetical protein